MVEFPAQVKDSAAKAYKEWAEAEGLSEDERRSKFGRAVRVSARYLPELRKEVRSGDLVWYSDQPKIGGGKGEHPGALQHFVAGLPLCQMTHYGERASAGGLRLDDLEVSVVGRFVAMSGRGFESLEYEVRVSSPEPADKIRDLARAAANDCYVTNTLKRSCRVTGKVVLNGQALVDL
ncbi:MAG: OsmC family protein [Nitrososphaerota archaeon]|nr:OsmC family protein [Nitrososphaerota archaeon]